MIAPTIWERLGDVQNYVEPFCGSCAVLLARPTKPKTETINDKDGLLANFWRAASMYPDEVYRHADWPVNEADLIARHNWMVSVKESLTLKLMEDPSYCDPKIAGWWVWGISAWIGRDYTSRPVGTKRLPDIKGGRRGEGIHSGDIPVTNQRLPKLTGDYVGDGVHSLSGMDRLKLVMERMRRVRVACGDWDRVMGPSVIAHTRTSSVGLVLDPAQVIPQEDAEVLTGIVLDPPYDDGLKVYATNDRISEKVRAWCIQHDHFPTLRIALCGYEGEHNELEDRGWKKIAWKARGGYGGQGNGDGRLNSFRERVWFSPSCIHPEDQASLDIPI